MRSSYAALLVAVLLLAGCRGESAGSPPPSATPAPEPPTAIAWWSQGTLHVGDTALSTRKPVEIRYAGGTTIVRHHLRWSLLVDHHLAGMGSVAGDPAISPDGSRVAWISQSHRRRLGTYRSVYTFRVVLRTTATDHVTWSAPWRAHVRCCDAGGLPQVQRVSDAGRVIGFANGVDPAWAWRPGRGRHDLAGVSWQRFTNASSRHADRGEDLVRTLPLGDGRWELMGRESATDVVVARVTGSGTSRVHAVERCDVAAGTCAAVPDGPEGYAVLPSRFD